MAEAGIKGVGPEREEEEEDITFNTNTAQAVALSSLNALPID